MMNVHCHRQQLFGWWSLICFLLFIIVSCQAGSSSSNNKSIRTLLGTNRRWNPLSSPQKNRKHWKPQIDLTKRQKYQRQSNSLRFTTNSNEEHDDDDSNDGQDSLSNIEVMNRLRAGYTFDKISNTLTIGEQIIKIILHSVTNIGIVILPPVFIIISQIFKFYQQLPHDAIMAQAGLVYCFAGGYFPTLFAAITAAQHSGINIMLAAINDLYTEGNKALHAAIEIQKNPNFEDYTSNEYTNDFNINNEKYNPSFWGTETKTNQNKKKFKDMTFHEKFIHQTRIVLTTIDPMKINTALSSLYTTWLGISSVLERQFAKTIALSISIADSLEPITTFIFKPPLQLLMPDDFSKWIPLLIQWSCKAIAMSFAWKIQRILTASSSALVGGLMFSRHLLRMIFGKTKKKNTNNNDNVKMNSNTKNNQRQQDEQQQQQAEQLLSTNNFDEDSTPLDEVIGLLVAAMGLYTQIGNGFSFEIPFPFSLITWPFALVENWIQWQITKKPQ